MASLFPPPLVLPSPPTILSLLFATFFVSASASVSPLYSSVSPQSTQFWNNKTTLGPVWKPNSRAKGFGTHLHHRDSLDSPYRQTYQSEADRYRAYGLSDRSRAKALTAKFQQNENFAAAQNGNFSGRKLLDFAQGLTYTSGIYYVAVYLGIPKQRTTLLFDTGSNLIWTKCVAKKGKRPPIPIYKPSASRSSKTVSCSEKICRNYGLGPTWTKCYRDTTKSCPFTINYYSGSSGGIMFKDRIVVPRTKGKSFVLQNLVFGCDYGSTAVDGLAGGIMGAGRSSLSFPSQLKPYYNNIFSTCLTPRSSPTTGQVIYGPAAVPYPPPKYTPILTNSDDGIWASYFVSVTSLSVAGIPLSLPPNAFSHSSPYSGVVLDTGSNYATLRSSVWLPLVEALRKKTKGGISMPDIVLLDGTRLAPCFSGEGTRWPSIKFSFKGGASVTLQGKDYLASFYDNTLCNVILEGAFDDPLNILGALVLRNQLVVWDRKNNRIGFKATNCATGKPL